MQRYQRSILKIRKFRYTTIKYIPGKFEANNQTKLTQVDFKKENGVQPVVCILGWLGSQWKYLDKYSNWYSCCNIPTFSYIPNLTSMINISKTDENALKLLKELKEISKNHPIVIHSLSGNGLSFWSRMVHLMSSNDEFKTLKENIKGVIVDSAPPKISPKGVCWCSAFPKCDSLFIYSKNDLLVDESDIKEHIKLLRDNHFTVDELYFDVSQRIFEENIGLHQEMSAKLTSQNTIINIQFAKLTQSLYNI
eukprot:gene12972-7630_t